jgi:hypothetical protein
MGRPHCIGAKRVQIQSSSVVQAALDLERRSCCPLDYLSNDPFTVVTSFYMLSRNTVSLRRHVECVVRQSRVRFARGDALLSRVPLLLPASDSLVGSKVSESAPAHRLNHLKPSFPIAECRT